MKPAAGAGAGVTSVSFDGPHLAGAEVVVDCESDLCGEPKGLNPAVDPDVLDSLVVADFVEASERGESLVPDLDGSDGPPTGCPSRVKPPVSNKASDREGGFKGG